MATQTFKIAANNAEFPFLYARAGRSVLQPGQDVAPRTSAAFVGTTKSFDWNLIKMIYCENVLPIAEGIISTGTQEDIAAFSPAVTDFDQVITIRDSIERNYLMVPARGKNYVLNPATLVWESKNPFTWAADKKIVTRAYVDGRTFICYERDRVIEWDPVGLAFTTLTLTLPAGYSMSDIRGCFGASNYLGLFTDAEILWALAPNVLDFSDSAAGAGRQTPIDLKGQITCCETISGGFVVYTTRNAVAGFFTNNAATPFTFREVQGSGGVAGYEQLTSDANQAKHYTYGSSGLQELDLQRADLIHPECSDFLSQRQYETWDSVAGEIVSSFLGAALEVKLQFLANRYLVISYGKKDGQFTYALFFDVGLQRWGKVRVDHMDITVLPSAVIDSIGFRWFELTGAWEEYDVAWEDLEKPLGTILPLRTGFAFLQNTGAVRTLQAEMPADNKEGVAIFGHVQAIRGRAITFNGSILDGVYDEPVPEVRIMGSLPTDGYARMPATATYTLSTTSKRMQILPGDSKQAYENFDLVLEGKFALSSAVLETVIHGAR
jgi:hypothetical protein